MKTKIICLSSLLVNLLLLTIILNSNGIFNKILPVQKYDIVLFGNSLTASGKWNKYLRVKSLKISGNPGFTTSHFVIILNRDVIQYKPKLCFIEGGINDIIVGIPLKRTFQNYQKIVDSLRVHHIEPILQSVLYVNYNTDSLNFVYNSKVDTLNAFLNNLARSRSLIYLNINQYLSSNGKLRNEFNVDGVHINEKGYKIWADNINKLLIMKGF